MLKCSLLFWLICLGLMMCFFNINIKKVFGVGRAV
jgi:hypothetical protein